ncbi:MAG: DUF5011 domain-containing protein, partial [Gammaproteobacteria bacterium]|nr:DUF5011 domain-containing protein [Gammaproteobacteria bacterium]
NEAVTKTRTVNVITAADTTKPVITLNGSTPVSIELGDSYNDAGATASDDIDGDITANITTDSTVNTAQVGSYTVTYNVSDAAGNTATAVVRTVNVTPDVTKPVISLSGNNPDSIVTGSPYIDAGATAMDNIDGNVSGNIISSGSVNTNTEGTYFISYNVSDSAGNEAVTKTRTVNVITAADTTKPVITLNGSTPVSIELGDSYNDAGATATDDIDGDITLNIVTENTVDVNQEGSYSVVYNVSDAAGNSAITVVRTINVTSIEDITSPLVTAPGNIVTDSVGRLTTVAIGQATATDNVDGDLIASPDKTGPFAPGRHQIVWSATDAAGNTGSAIQLVDVQPIVEFSANQLSESGATVSIRVLLNGDAASYPVDVDYQVFVNGASGPSSAGSLAISVGREGSIDYLVPSSILSGDIVFKLVSASNGVVGPIALHQVTIINSNIEPLAELELTQNNTLTRIVTTDLGSVVTEVVVNDVNLSDTHLYDWSGTDNILLGSNPGESDSEFSFDPATLLPGFYRIAVKVTDDGQPNLGSEVDLYVQVLQTSPVLSSNDSDGDGINDITEGIGDIDNDGIPDYLDDLEATSLIPGKAGVTDSWLLNVQPGLRLRLGKLSLLSGRYTSGVTADEVEQYSGKSGGSAPANTVDDYTNVGGIFDFEISGLQEPGQSIMIVLPQHTPIPNGGTYRKYTETLGWQSFVEDSENVLYSASGQPGLCPPPGDSQYTPGLTSEHHCVQLLLEDGGPNDADSTKNGVIKDPGGVSIEDKTSSDPDKPTGGGSGRADASMLIVLLGLTILVQILSRRRNQLL